jgi:uncharacterized glyoxalase superfamily protein PhnB
MTPNRSMPVDDIMPILHYRDMSAAIAWLVAAFGVRERLRISDHRAQLLLGEGAFVVATEDREDRWRGAPSAVLVRIASVDAHYARAVAAGAQIDLHPTTYPFGERQYIAVDVGGHEWTFSESVRDVDPAEWGGLLTNVSLLG